VTRRRARRTASLVLLLLAGCSAAPSGSSSPEAAGTTDATCADLVVIGARGSTQDPTLNAGVGTEVRRTTEQLVARLQKRSDHTVGVQAIRYDAALTSTVDDYLSHTAEGSRMMTQRLRSLARRCDDSRFALVGFSQGAQVVHGTASSMGQRLAGRVVLVAMIADPTANPADEITHWSYADEPTRGNGRLGSGPPIDADLRGVAISLCVDGDEICNDRGAPGGPPSSTHKRFYELPSSTRETARQLDRVLRSHGV
jgi:cutinase